MGLTKSQGQKTVAVNRQITQLLDSCALRPDHQREAAERVGGRMNAARKTPNHSFSTRIRFSMGGLGGTMAQRVI